MGHYCTNKAADDLVSSDFKVILTLPNDFEGDMQIIKAVGLDAYRLYIRCGD